VSQLQFSEPGLISFAEGVLSILEGNRGLLEASYSEIPRRPPKDPVRLLTGLILQPLLEAPSWRYLALKLNEPQIQRVLRFRFNHNDFSQFTLRVGPRALECIFEETVLLLRKEIPLLGETVGIDSTLIEAYANPAHQILKTGLRRPWPHGDPHAAFTKTRDTNGTEKWVHGYKVHGAADAEFWLPLTYLVTPASNNDSPFFIPLLMNLERLGFTTKFAVGDAGYDSIDSKIYALSHQITPIIKRNPRSSITKPSRTPSIDEILSIKPGSDQWNATYHLARKAVERLWGQDKVELNLGHALKLRSLDRVRVHVATTFLTLNMVALIGLRYGYMDLVRSMKPWRFQISNVVTTA
jgi:hypothetical protein